MALLWLRFCVDVDGCTAYALSLLGDLEKGLATASSASATEAATSPSVPGRSLTDPTKVEPGEPARPGKAKENIQDASCHRSANYGCISRGRPIVSFHSTA
jgi:hypothetical protein